jgi:hypothetical protein
MFKHLSQMTPGDRFWFPLNVAENVSARYIGEFPEGHAFRIDGDLNCRRTHADRLFELAN